MKILQYNLFEGCRDKDRLQFLHDFLHSERLDAAGFNELNGWSSSDFQEFVCDAGFSHSVLFEMKTSPYYVGFASQYPIETIEKNEDEFHHGYLLVKTNGIQFLVTHLSPRDASNREGEAAIIANKVKQLNEPIIVMGDLNTLSGYDLSFYQENLSTLLDRPRLIRKFMKDGEISTKPMEILLEAGLFDTLRADGFQPTVPTPVNDDVMHALPMRLDYILVNGFLNTLKPKSKVFVNGWTEKISDHYPIICEWD